MKVGLAYPVDSLSGAAAARSGLVFFGWRNMQVARRYVVPANPDTTSQDAIRSYLAAAAAGFQGCSAAQKQAWATFAALYPKRVQGVDVIMPEISAYCMVNQWRQIDGQALSATAPSAKPDFAITGITSMTESGANMEIVFTHSASVVTSKLVAFKITAPLPSLMKVPTESDYRMITGVENATCIIPLAASPQTAVFATSSIWTALAASDDVGISIMPLSPSYAPGLWYSAVKTIA